MRWRKKEVESLRSIVQWQRKELRAKMLKVSREEFKRKWMLDERSNHKPQWSYSSLNKVASNTIPFIDLLRKICNFLLQRVKSKKIVKNIKRNILVSGSRMGRARMGE
ncbi:hypothetical protein Scep_004501 [Stephania cephalantha]|uniref:Uncharacterized protein n=1 Tax=Stephania cephalantha TaxID=152367 RepID=A0AAP0PVF2_9MAGN